MIDDHNKNKKIFFFFKKKKEKKRREQWEGIRMKIDDRHARGRRQPSDILLSASSPVQTDDLTLPVRGQLGMFKEFFQKDRLYRPREVGKKRLAP